MVEGQALDLGEGPASSRFGSGTTPAAAVFVPLRKRDYVAPRPISHSVPK
jgi:hypothetical protein